MVSRVCVTGAAGFIGRHTVERLLAQGNDVVAIDRRPLPSDLQRSWPRGRLRTVQLDLAGGVPVSVLKGCDSVIHLAAKVGLSTTWSELPGYLDDNAVATMRLLQSCGEADVSRFVHASTSSVYGAVAEGGERSPTRPVSAYGVSKLAAENLVLANSGSGTAVVVARLFSVYGPGQRPDMAYRRMFEALWYGREIVVFGDGLQMRSNTFVRDCVHGLLSLLEKGKAGEIYNICGAESINLLEAIELIFEVTGHRVPVRFRTPRLGDQVSTSGSFVKATMDVGYRPVTLLREGLRHQWEWQQKALATANETGAAS